MRRRANTRQTTLKMGVLDGWGGPGGQFPGSVNPLQGAPHTCLICNELLSNSKSRAVPGRPSKAGRVVGETRKLPAGRPYATLRGCYADLPNGGAGARRAGRPPLHIPPMTHTDGIPVKQRKLQPAALCKTGP